MSSADSDRSLEGLRVLDLSQMLAGPICGMRLGDLGADVIKVETPMTGEWTRTHGFDAPLVGGETTAQLGLNRNKRSVAINLKHPLGRATFLRLVATSDVVLQNFRVGTVERLGVSWEDCRAVNPRIVYCSISGYGSNGSLASRPGQDLVLQGYSGSMYSVGSAASPPTPGGLWAIDAMTGYQAAIGILAALRYREASGEGQHVEVDMLSVVMDAQSQEITTFLNTGATPTRGDAPTAHALMNAPYGVYRAADGWMVLAMSNLSDLGAALENEWLCSLETWSDGTLYKDEVYDVVTRILPTRTTDEWLNRFDTFRVWAGPVLDYAGLMALPHIEQRNMVVSVEHPTAGVVRLLSPPIRMSGSPLKVSRHPPLLGEHTDEVLRDLLALDDSEISELRSEGVL